VPNTPDDPGFTVRRGYAVEVVTDALPGARFLQLDDQGHLYTSRPRQGDIIAFAPTDDGKYRQLGVFIENRPLVQGMHFVGGWLYLASDGKIERARDTDRDGSADEVQTILEDLPRGGGHWWRPVLVTDRSIYTSIGDANNASDQADTDRQKIWRFNLDGAERTLFASGIRNTEKLRLRPGTDEVWGFDHGSDQFGRGVGDTDGNQPVTDLNPPDELNRYQAGGFYGHPFITGLRVPRYEFLDREDIHDLAANTTPPEWTVGAHWACNGWTFIDPAINQATGAFPADHAGDIVVAAHGSWNSSARVGYCIARVIFDKDPINAGHPVGLVKLVSCLDAEGKILARPVDVVQHPDGSLLFSVDSPQGRVYRLRYTGE
jgi:glucose/arabinose dehydrogenase